MFYSITNKQIIQGHKVSSSQTCWGLRYSLTSSSMMSSVYSWVITGLVWAFSIFTFLLTDIMASHSTSRGAGSRAQISFKASAIYKDSYKHIINILRLLTASSLVVSVMYWSSSSMTVLQREQVRSFLGGGAWVVVRGRRRVKRNNNDNFMAITQLIHTL